MKQFKPTSWSIDNRTSIYIITLMVSIFGIISYQRLQKEQFPDIVIPTMMVATVYPGNSPADMENLVTRPIEKQLKSLSGIKKVTSTSSQDFCLIQVEFNTNVQVADAKQKTKDAVDKARTDLPSDLPQQPDVREVNFSDIPIMFVNLSGNFSNEQLKKYAEDLQDRIESMKEITRVDIVGALDREVKVDVDMYKMQAASVTFADVERAIKLENMTISGGNVRVGDFKRAVRVVGQYTDPNAIGDIVVKSVRGANVYIKDIADVQDAFEERESYARLGGKPVITLNIIKRSGQNLIESSDKVQEIVKELKSNSFPKDLKVTITGDMSNNTRHTLNDLINTIIIGFILVTLILMFFMGTTNALFVGLSVPISMFLAFLIFPMLGFSLNMIVLFSFLLALGIVVDDAIVVIENTHRIYHQTHTSIVKSAKLAAGEVFIPVLAGTLTTVAPFLPLAFWPGMIGKFMFYLPITLIVTLMASLVVAFIINPVFAVDFMANPEAKPEERPNRKMWIGVGVLTLIGLIGYAFGSMGVGNLMLFIAAMVLINKFVFTGWISAFQQRGLPKFQRGYERLLKFCLRSWHPYAVLASVLGMLVLSVVLVGIRSPKVVFFPQGDPNFVYTYITMPVGTDQAVTDSVTKLVEHRIKRVVGENNPDVESIISNVAIGAGDPRKPSIQAESNKGKVSVAFVEFQYRENPHTSIYLDRVREAVKGIPGAVITVEKEQSGPPVGKPIAIEITGENYNELVKLSKRVERHLDSVQVAGIEDLRSDLEDQKPEIVLNIDRVRANREGLSTAQIGLEVRTAIFGKEASKFKRDEDEYPIQIRYAQPYRENIDALMDMKITYRDMNTGLVRQIPLSSVASMEYSNTYGGIQRKNMKRIITLGSNVLGGYNANEVNANIMKSLQVIKLPPGYEIKQGGEQADQVETMNFLGMAGIIALGLIFLILVVQFNSLSKPLIILSEIIFSTIGVLLGFAITGMSISIVMTGIGIVALAGIVVKNGILLVEFADVLRTKGHEGEHKPLPLLEAVIDAGKTRLNPVILTATAAILGLIPLAIGLNLNFFTLFSEFNPHFFIGGPNVVFWGPLAWTIIFGLSFATVLTLLVVPSMYLLSERLKLKVYGNKRAKDKELVTAH